MMPVFCSTREMDAVFSRRPHLFFVGIGGIQMHALALLLKGRGFFVSGSDRAEGETLASLRAAGIPVFAEHREENIEGAEAVIYSLAVAEDTPELCAARRRGIPILSRPDLLGWLMHGYRRRIAVAGMHGKSTTTAMLSHMLCAQGMSPTVLGGAPLDRTGCVFLEGGGEDIFLSEACEYKDAFLCLTPDIAVVLNTEHEHPDYFRDYAHVLRSFSRFVCGAGTVILPSDGEGLTIPPAARILRFGMGGEGDADICAEQLSLESGFYSFSCCVGDACVARASLSVPGLHNVKNALAALCVIHALGLDLAASCRALADFAGTPRRLARRGRLWGMTVYDDYAHHPTEIRASLSALRDLSVAEGKRGRILCVFEPHTYSRTAAFFGEFTEALSMADLTILLPIYAAREKNKSGVSSEMLAASLENGRYAACAEDAFSILANEARAGDVLVLMGAGSIRSLTDELPCEP